MPGINTHTTRNTYPSGGHRTGTSSRSRSSPGPPWFAAQDPARQWLWMWLGQREHIHISTKRYLIGRLTDGGQQRLCTVLEQGKENNAFTLHIISLLTQGTIIQSIMRQSRLNRHILGLHDTEHGVLTFSSRHKSFHFLFPYFVKLFCANC